MMNAMSDGAMMCGPVMMIGAGLLGLLLVSSLILTGLAALKYLRG